MKGMQNRVMAFVLAFIMIIANVMTVAATEGADAEKYVENFDKLVDFTNKISELFASECKVVKKTNNVINEKV